MPEKEIRVAAVVMVSDHVIGGEKEDLLRPCSSRTATLRVSDSLTLSRVVTCGYVDAGCRPRRDVGKGKEGRKEGGRRLLFVIHSRMA